MLPIRCVGIMPAHEALGRALYQSPRDAAELHFLFVSAGGKEQSSLQMRLRQDVKLKLYCMLHSSIMSYASHKPPFHGGSFAPLTMVSIRVLSTVNAAAKGAAGAAAKDTVATKTTATVLWVKILLLLEGKGSANNAAVVAKLGFSGTMDEIYFLLWV